jgi:hypothetical protein
MFFVQKMFSFLIFIQQSLTKPVCNTTKKLCMHVYVQYHYERILEFELCDPMLLVSWSSHGNSKGYCRGLKAGWRGKTRRIGLSTDCTTKLNLHISTLGSSTKRSQYRGHRRAVHIQISQTEPNNMNSQFRTVKRLQLTASLKSWPTRYAH